MDDIYGPLKRSPMSILFFAVPAIAIAGIAVWLVAQDAGSIGAAFGSPVVWVCTALAVAAMIWGVVFTSRPIVTLTAEAMVWPNGTTVNWADVARVEEGQSTSAVASGDGSASSVVHEVMRVYHGDNAMTKIVTTWAGIGPQAANDRIKAGFAQSRR